MIEILLSWIWIGSCAFVIGHFSLLLLQKITNESHHFSIDMVLITGFCALTVYAEIFSLFYKVGLLANLLLLAIVSIVLLTQHTYFKEYFLYIKTNSNLNLSLILISIVGIFVLLRSNQPIDYTDTYLYHSQAIRWIEEYGIVPGLGNLHTRFAFNSSFLVLQALFSLKFLFGRSLHSVNGLFTWILLSYSILSMKAFSEKKIKISDGLRLTSFFLISYIHNISSPNTDLMSSGMMIYIFIKWLSLYEEKTKQLTSLPYAILCILAAWTASLKVASGAIAFMTIFIAYALINEKKWKNLLIYGLCDTLVVIPWIVRNFIISGYILYPYGAIDIFHVDWKIPNSQASIERIITTACGRGTYLKGSEVIETTTLGWIPIWFSSQKFIFKALFILTLLAIFFGIIIALQNLKRDLEFSFIYATMLVCFLFWFFGAPDVRFAISNTTMISILVFGTIIQKLSLRYIQRYISVIICFACIALSSRFLWKTITSPNGNILKSIDYEKIEVQSMEWNGITMYYPYDGESLIDYSSFPSCPYLWQLNNIELRNQTLKNGFRTKAEHEN